jgi:regulator of replication initiation timing
VEDFESLSEKVARITEECERLRGENARLRELLGQETNRREEPSCESEPKSKAGQLNGIAIIGVALLPSPRP